MSATNTLAAGPLSLGRVRSTRAHQRVWNTTLLRYSLLAYIFFLPVQFTVSDTLRVAPSDLLLVIFLFFGLTRIRFDRSAWSVFQVALLGVFILGTIRTAFDNPDLKNYVVLNKDLGLLVLFASYAMINTVARKWNDIRWMLRHLVIAVVLQTAIASAALFATQLSGISFSWINYGGTRLSGFLVDPNAFGGLVDVALLIHAITYFSKRPLIRGLFGAFCMVVLGAGLLLTLSRSAWIGFLAACLVLVFIRPRFAVHISILGALAALLLLVVLGGTKTQSLIVIAERPNTVQARVDQAAEALPLFVNNPILGAGLGGFGDRFGWIIHDTALWMLTDFGLLGFSVYLCFCLWFFAQGWRAYKLAPSIERPLVLALICAHLAMLGLSVGIEAFYQRHWWVVMALLASTLPVARQSRRPRVGGLVWQG